MQTPDDSVPLDLHTPKRDPPPQTGSSLDALKQAYMTNAILSTLRPTDMDLQIMSQFPELLSVIQQNPQLLTGGAGGQLQAPDLYRASLQQAVVNLTGKDNGAGNDVYPGFGDVSSTNNNSKKSSQSSVKKRRER